MRTAFKTALISAALLASAGARADVVNGFDAGLEGWTRLAGNIAWVATGGQSGGYIALTDTIGGGIGLRAVASTNYNGDLTSYLGGTFSFAVKNISGSPVNYDPFGTVTFFNGSNSISLDIVPAGEPAVGADWATYTTTLDVATWGAGLTSILSNVTQLWIILESYDQVVEINGLDSVALRSASTTVPEPGTLGLIGLGLVALGLRRRRA